MKIRSHLRIDERWQSQLSRVMQAILVGLIFIGLDRGNLDIAVNALVDLDVTYLPAIFERDYRIPMDIGLILWISLAAFLYALRTVDFPGSETSLYAGVQWWDHLTHVLSSPVIAAIGYVTVRAIDGHAVDIYLPPRFVFVFVLLFVLAFGAFWEVIELAISGVVSLAGTASVLTQYDLDDTLSDLVFDAVGGVIVVVQGTAHLSDVVGTLQRRFEMAPR